MLFHRDFVEELGGWKLYSFIVVFGAQRYQDCDEAGTRPSEKVPKAAKIFKNYFPQE